jgi:hypothetical protein
MKIVSKIAILAVLAALILAGCPNSLSQTSADFGRLNEQYDAQRTNRAGITFIMGSISGPAGTGVSVPLNVGLDPTATAPTKKYLKLSFNAGDSIDLATVPQALRIYKLKNADAATDVIVRNGEIDYTTETRAEEPNAIYLNLDITADGTSREIEFHIDATQLKGRNGTHFLDLDGDNTSGEAGDDDFYTYISVASVSNTDLSNPRVGQFRDPRHYITLASPTTALSATGTSSITITYNRVGMAGTEDNNYTTLFNDNIALQKYDPENNTWAAVTATRTYNETTGIYDMTWSGAQELEIYRVVLTNAEAIVTEEPFYGFTQKMQFSSALGTERILVDPTAVPSANQKTPTVWGGLSTPAIAFDNDGLNGYVIIDLSSAVATGGAIGNRGLDEQTVTTDNIKIAAYGEGSINDTTFFDPAQVKYWLPIETVTLGYANINQNSGAKDRLIIQLKPEYRRNIASTAVSIKFICFGPGLYANGDSVISAGPTQSGKFGNTGASYSINQIAPFFDAYAVGRF